jgi:hypothetical protein
MTRTEKKTRKRPENRYLFLAKTPEKQYNVVVETNNCGRVFSMAIITQTFMFDYREIEILGDLERLNLALAGIDDEKLMERLEKRRGNGRDDYPVRVMWNLFVAMIVFCHKTVESFRKELSRNSQLRHICGLYDLSNRRHLVPPSRVFSGFTKLLSEESEEIARIFNTQVETLYELIPDFGRTLAGDGKYLDSYAKREAKAGQTSTDNRTENDAEWSVKEYHYTDKDGKPQVKKEYHFGFKAHIICDVATELPIAWSVTEANGDEKKEMMKLLQCPVLSNEAHRRIAQYLLLDRGYDSFDMISATKGAGMSPIIDIRNCWKNGDETRQYKNTNMVYNYKGEVFYVECVDGKSILHKMKYEGYDRQKNRLRYSHNGKIHRINISYDERVFLPVARDSDKFKRLYKGRTAVERLNGRLDRDYMFEDHCIRGLKKMTMFVGLSMIIMNGMAVGKLKSGKKMLRSLKNVA